VQIEISQTSAGSSRQPWDGRTSHLHEFIVKGVSYTSTDPEAEMDDSEDEEKARLSDFASRARSSLRHIYDFGDGCRAFPETGQNDWEE
jgi:hypothetical protein